MCDDAIDSPIGQELLRVVEHTLLFVSCQAFVQAFTRSRATRSHAFGISVVLVGIVLFGIVLAGVVPVCTVLVCTVLVGVVLVSVVFVSVVFVSVEYALRIHVGGSQGRSLGPFCLTS